jgi:hypothetical protein
MTGGDFFQGRDTEIGRQNTVATYWHDHSLESSWGGLSDGTIIFFDSTGGCPGFSKFLAYIV